MIAYPLEIHTLDSDDEISSGEEDEDCLPPNYKFFSERISHANQMLKQLRNTNQAVEALFTNVTNSVGIAKKETLN